MPSSCLWVPLHAVAHGRTGDKDDDVNISVCAFKPSYFPFIESQVTEERVREHFAFRSPTAVQRFTISQIGALNLVIRGVLGGGVTDSLYLDPHGKTLAFHLLEMPVLVPEGMALEVVDAS